MYDYVTTKPELEEALYHASFHKYINRYMGKNGKWVYEYAKKAKNPYVAIDEVATNARKKVSGVVDSVKNKDNIKKFKKGIKTVSAVQKNNRKILKKASQNKEVVDAFIGGLVPQYKTYKKGKKIVNTLKKK